MKNILLLAYAVSPHRGSEYAVAWTHILNMAKYNKITVLYGTSGDHMGDFEDMEIYLMNNKIDNVTFIPIKPSKRTKVLNYLNVKNLFNYSFYWAYASWQAQVLLEVEKLMKKNKYDLVHFLCPIGYREPGKLWKLDIPYIWGPICGVNNTPWQLFNIMSFKGKVRYCIRNVANYMQFKYSHRIKKALDGVDLLLTATTETQEMFKKYHLKDSIHIPENAITDEPKINKEKFLHTDVKYKVLYVGRLDDNKGCIFLLKALTRIKKRHLIEVDIIGDGPLRGKLEEYVYNNCIDDIVTFCGKLPRIEVLQKFKDAHLHVITSLSEANTTVIWEAMTHGVPTLSLDHCGMHDTICPKCGIKIPVISSEQIASDIAREIENLLEHPQNFETLAHGTIECAKKYMWDERRKQMNHYYDLAIERYNQKRVSK